MYPYVFAAIFVLGTSTASFAAEELFVAQDPATKDCKTTKKKPDGTSMVMVGTVSYKTNEEAKAAKKAAPECKRAEGAAPAGKAAPAGETGEAPPPSPPPQP